MARKGRSFSVGLLADSSKESPYQRSAVEQGLAPAREWDVAQLPPMPPDISSDEARRQINAGFDVVDPRNQRIRFDNAIIEHWIEKQNYDEKQVNGRLTYLNVAKETVSAPAEIWDQGTQRAYVQLFVKPTGGKRGCVVFVDNNHVAFTYFPKDTNAMEKVRKGIKIG